MRVAVCESILHARDQLVKWIEHYCALYGIELEIGEFQKTEQLMSAMGLRKFDVIFIGFFEPEGFLAARQAREMDRDVNIVYIGDTAEYAVKGVRLHFLDYIVRPVTFRHIVRVFSLLGNGVAG